MFDSLIRAIRADISRKLHEINGARIKRGICIRQDPRLMELSDQVFDDFMRLAELDPERAAWYRKCAANIIVFRKLQPATLKEVA